jgi:hypothetical protein
MTIYSYEPSSGLFPLKYLAYLRRDLIATGYTIFLWKYKFQAFSKILYLLWIG